MDIVKQFKRQVEQAGWFNSSQTAVVAVSAGVDSMVLLTLMQQLPAGVRPRLVRTREPPAASAKRGRGTLYK